MDAIDLLDSISAGFNPSRSAVLHGALTLALHITVGDAEQVALVHELEQYVLGKVDRLSPEAVNLAGPAASRLRHAKGTY